MILNALVGTDYTAEVTRTYSGDYEVRVTKPAVAEDPYATVEIVAHVLLPGEATMAGLEKLVLDIVNADRNTLVGKYTGGAVMNNEEVVNDGN